MIPKSVLAALSERQVDYAERQPLKPLSTFRIGGEAELVLYPDCAEKLAAALGKPVTFLDDEGTCGLLSCADKCIAAFGMPDKDIEDMIVLQAEWIKSGGRQLDKPTHFQETRGNF